MNFNDYQQKSRITAKYRAIGHPLIYPTLGLTNEAGEVAGKIKKIFRDKGGQINEETRAALQAELGDVLWYVARLAAAGEWLLLPPSLFWVAFALAVAHLGAAFAREAIANLADSGRARIESLRVGDHAVAVLVSLIAGATAYTWKIAYDEACGRFSPGAQLMLEVPARLAGTVTATVPVAVISAIAVPDP